jgi:hypothetical protein
MQKYQCCFCGDVISLNEVDVTSIIIVTNWDKNQDKQNEQQLFCHIECLKNRLAKSINLYVDQLD